MTKEEVETNGPGKIKDFRSRQDVEWELVQAINFYYVQKEK